MAPVGQQAKLRRLAAKQGLSLDVYTKINKANFMGPTKEFPGVDIDAVHRNPRWKKIKEAA